MAASANDVWSGWATTGTQAATLSSGVVTAAPSSGQSALYTQSISVKGGDHIELAVWAKPASGIGRAFIHLDSYSSVILSDAQVTGHVDYRVYRIKGVVPSARDYSVAVLGVGVYASANGSATFRGISVKVNGNPILPGFIRNGWRSSATDEIRPVTAETDRGVLDSSGRFVMGHTAAVTDSSAQRLVQTHGASITGFGTGRWSADNSSAVLSFMKSRGVVGTHTVGNAGDAVAEIRGQISDGTAFRQVGNIQLFCDGGTTPSSTNAPGNFRIQLSPAGSVTPTEVMRWRPDGRVTIGGSGGAQIIAGTGTPEGVVTAPVGSTFRRTDGGAATTFYVKESGTGNTGWVGK